MRIVLLVTDHERGGTPLRLARLARELHAAGVEVWAGCLAPPGPVSADLAAAGIATFACAARGPGDVAALGRLARHVRRIRPDALHATLVHANVAARLVGRLLGVPVVGSTATIEVARAWPRALERATARLDRAHVVHSRALAGHVVRVFGLPPQRVHIVPPVLEVPPRVDRAAARAELGVPDAALGVAWVGRMDPVKRLDVLVACAGLLRDLPAWFLLAGDGPDRARIARLARARGVADRVHLLGWRSALGPVLSAADVFLLPSRTEGLPNAVLEAMACGLPVVAGDIPPLRELVGDPPRCLLVPGGRAAGLAAALRRLHADAELRAALGRRAEAWARPFADPRPAVAALLDVYRRVVR